MNHPGITKQWLQLFTVTAIHFLADMFVGMVPALLPRIRMEFGMSLVAGAALITTLNIVCNGIQVLVGHLRSDKTIPIYLPVGMILSAGMCLLVFLPRSGSVEIWVFLLIIVSGIGTGLVHPEGFRAIHALEGITASASTAVYMIGGMLGFGMGAWISTLLVSRWGLLGLWGLGPVSLAVVLVLLFLKVRLAAETDPQGDINNSAGQNRVSFWPIWLMTIPASIATAVIIGLLPSRLEELGFELEFGGFSNMLFIAGAVVGTLFWSGVSRHRSNIGTCTVALFLGIPFLLIHLLYIEHRLAAWLLAPCGFCVMAAYPLMVTAARFARGLNLGGRMAMTAGGTWGVASLSFMFFGAMADRWSVEAVMKWMWLGYVLSVIIGIYIMRMSRKRS